jgi:hypothetical protein
MSAGIEPTYQNIMAASRDAGNSHAAKHGRGVWSVDDYNTAASVSHRLFVKFDFAPAPKTKKIRANRVHS